MKLSVVDPITPAIEHTKKVLFQPFDFGKWLRLGFCAFLMGLAEGGGSFNGGNSGGRSGGDGPDMDPVMDWIRDNLAIILAIVAAVVVLGIIIGVTMTWLSSRGHFMFLDGVVKNRGAVVEPWREFRAEGNSLFWFRIVLGLAGLLILLVLAGLCGLIALPDISAQQFGMFAIAAIVVGIFAVLLFALAMGCVGILLMDFVVPVMYLHRIRVMEAWRVTNESLLSGNLGAFVLYFLFKMVIGLLVGLLALVATCLTCCITIIPYVGTVILLPLIVFVQCYPLFFIEQFGPKWKIIPDSEPPAEETGQVETTNPF